MRVVKLIAGRASRQLLHVLGLGLGRELMGDSAAVRCRRPLFGAWVVTRLPDPYISGGSGRRAWSASNWNLCLSVSTQTTSRYLQYAAWAITDRRSGGWWRAVMSRFRGADDLHVAAELGAVARIGSADAVVLNRQAQIAIFWFLRRRLPGRRSHTSLRWSALRQLGNRRQSQPIGQSIICRDDPRPGPGLRCGDTAGRGLPTATSLYCRRAIPRRCHAGPS